MVGEVFRRPSFFIWFAAMFLTAASELAPGQWIDVALSNRVGMRGILLLVYVNALMFVFRHFAGRLANKISNPGRSEEHTSELQSLMRISYAVFCLKKKKKTKKTQ